jgi:hypothetical protein
LRKIYLNSHLKEPKDTKCVRALAEGKITLEEVTRAILDAIRDLNLRLADQGAFYNPPEEPATIELDMEAFN